MVPWKDAKEHEAFLSTMKEGTLRSNAQIIEELTGLQLNSEDQVYRAAKLMCELLTKQSLVFTVNLPGNSNWRRDLLSKENSNGMMNLAICFLDEIAKFVIQLYEEDFGSVRETIQYLDDQSEPNNIPYLSTFLRTALEHLPGIRSDEIIFEKIRQAMDSRKLLIQWCEEQKARGSALKYYGGQTNTWLGLYTELFQRMPQLPQKLIPNAEINIDLGGGFATPEVSENLGQKYTSYDLICPRDAREMGLQFKVDKRNGKTVDTEAYLDLLDTQAFQKFDVFENDFPDGHQTYNICSFGFLNSSVKSLSPARPEFPAHLQALNTMFFCCWRIVRLAAKGKNVVLLTYGRAHQSYMNKLMVFRFQEGRALEVYIPAHIHSKTVFATGGSVGHNFSRQQLSSLLNQQDDVHKEILI